MKKIPKDIQAEVDKRLVEMLGFVDYKAVITVDKAGFAYIGKERIDESRLSNLKSEAEFLSRSDIWKLLNETMRYYAYEKMFIKSESLNDLLTGKMWIYHLDTQQKILEMFKSHKKNNIPPPPPTGMKK